MNSHDDNETPQEKAHHRRSLPSHLLWRSILGTPAAWSGGSSRGVHLLDSIDNQGGNHNENKSMIQNIITDRRMYHLPNSLRDFVVNNLRSSTAHNINSKRNKRKREYSLKSADSSSIQLLSHPRIVGAATSSARSGIFNSSSTRIFSGSGISCMDLDRGNDADSLTGSPPRYLLVGSGGGDCSIALYDLSYFGSDSYLYQQQSLSHNNSHTNSQSLHSQSKNQASVTHRPIARSLRQKNDSHTYESTSGGVPSGHRQPLLGVNWYPGDVYGAFVSSSISGEILVWDAQNFVPVFATYTHVYTGLAERSRGGIESVDYEENKSVAPLQCMDIPKTPEGCPHGNALLALGLGADGRGVIQLCDAFRGGSATHELIGHGSTGGSGGVNAVAWDPHHPFRLASGGDDCTVRLWDIRKAGAAACLGVLDREKGMLNGGDGIDDWAAPPQKRQKSGFSMNNMSRMRGVESHGGPVTAIAFAPGGDDLVSTGQDGGLYHWDLRPDSCFVSSIAAISGRKRSCTESVGSGMDPSVATGGRLMPTCFSTGSRKHLTNTSKQQRQSRRNKATLAIIQPGSRCTTTLLTTANHGNSIEGEITGYSLFGRRGKEPGGSPDFVLNGHLADVTCLAPTVKMWDNLKVGRCDDTINHVDFLTGGKDGMVLSWGSSRRNVSTNETNSDDKYPGFSKWQSRLHDSNTEAFNRSGELLEEAPLVDIDAW